MTRISIILAAAFAVAACTETEVVVNDHYGVCTADEQCPGTYVCQDGICIEPEEPPQSVADCATYEWAGRETPWHCWCEGDNCIGTDAELPWECPLDLLDSDPNDGVCGVQCHDHFWLDAQAVGLDPNTSPPSLTFDVGNGVVTCTQYVDISPLRFVRSQTEIYLDAPDGRTVQIDYRMTAPAIVEVFIRYNEGAQWINGGLAFTYTFPGGPTNIGGVRYGFRPEESFPSGTTTYWKLEAHRWINNELFDTWTGSITLP
ncbi:MAG: hypothetical protein KBC69_04130 [Candidatus Magasanikbacteria bacterium]|nr:hypothetical protein [Candidatus Magasanikbacteria bacterium]